ncbi:hypothetical protein QT995_04890 [Microcoleus sp. S36b_A3]|uniref:hypothetical protein n=1 Tax=unclassified Microcoleus TaxID=2642155 RepID=UPI002FD12355
MQKLGGVPFTASTIATKAESNTPAIEQTAFVTLQPPRKLLAVPAFASANAQTKFAPAHPVSLPATKNYNSASWQIVRTAQFLGY